MMENKYKPYEKIEIPNSNPHQSVYTGVDVYTPRIQARTKKSKISKKITAIVACVMAFSIIAGAGGGFLAAKYILPMTEGASYSSSLGNSSSVMQQAVIKTVNTSGEEIEELSISEVVALTENSVVEITTEVVTSGGMVGQYVSEGAGSGVIVSEDGYILTNHHVIDGAEKITVTTKNGESYIAELIGSDSDADVAVLKISATGLSAAILGDSDTLTVGETAIAIGNPLGQLGGTVTAGIISALDREITIDGTNMNLLQFSAAINPGNSGGGLFNTQGQLIALVNAKSSGTDVEGLGFAIPINTAKEIADQIIEYGYVRGRIDSGVTLIDINDTMTAMMYRIKTLGVYVYEVDDYSSALQVGDRIVSVNSQEISTSADFDSALEQYSVGDTVTIQIVRDGTAIDVNLTLGERKA